MPPGGRCRTTASPGEHCPEAPAFADAAGWHTTLETFYDWSASAPTSTRRCRSTSCATCCRRSTGATGPRRRPPPHIRVSVAVWIACGTRVVPLNLSLIGAKGQLPVESDPPTSASLSLPPASRIQVRRNGSSAVLLPRHTVLNIGSVIDIARPMIDVLNVTMFGSTPENER